MRNYQILVLIGGVITIVLLLSASLLYNINHAQTITQKEAANLFGGATIGILINVAAMVLVFAIQHRYKPLGITLIALGVILIVLTLDIGFIGLVLFVISGILCLRYKPKQMKLTK